MSVNLSTRLAVFKPHSDGCDICDVMQVQQIDRVVEVVEETLKGHTVRLMGQKKLDGKRLGMYCLSHHVD